MQLTPGLDFYDVHGAGAQRTDPKSGEPSYGFGPQGDVRRVYNYVRFVRDTENVSQLGYENTGLPGKFKLEQNYPNPFNPTTTIEYTMPEVEDEYLRPLQSVKLIVYDILGREVQTLVNEQHSPGNYKITFDAGVLPSGIYFYKLSLGDYNETKKMILLR